jgi:hypothetical protein
MKITRPPFAHAAALLRRQRRRKRRQLLLAQAALRRNAVRRHLGPMAAQPTADEETSGDA